MILFLDFDGVLHPVNREDGVFSREEHLARVLRDYPHVQVVISSSWRCDYTLANMKTFFLTDLRSRIIGVTPHFMGDGLDHENFDLREQEIYAWLRSAGREHEPWIALDDSDWLFSSSCLHLLLVDASTGFDDVTERALRTRLGPVCSADSALP